MNTQNAPSELILVPISACFTFQATLVLSFHHKLEFAGSQSQHPLDRQTRFMLESTAATNHDNYCTIKRSFLCQGDTAKTVGYQS